MKYQIVLLPINELNDSVIRIMGRSEFFATQLEDGMWHVNKMRGSLDKQGTEDFLGIMSRIAAIVNVDLNKPM